MLDSQPQVERTVNLRLVAGLNRGFHPLPMSPLGKIIIRELKRLGQPQSWLAENVGVSENAVSKWIATGKIARSNAMKVSPLIGVSLDQLLNPSASEDPDEEWRKLSPLLKARLISIVHEIRGATDSPPSSRKANK